MKFDFKRLLPHLVVFVVFIIAALAYFHPVLSGKKLYQNDIVQYKANARQLIDYRAETGEELYWTDAIFGGMPTYQLGARYPYDFIDQLDRAIRFLPRPADYLFLYFACFYVLMLVLKVDWRIGLLGSLAFGFSTYLIIILGVGHNAKAHAIAYFPLVLSGILLVFKRRYVMGSLLTALALALELQAGHPQMTYYLLLGVIVIGTVYLYQSFKEKTLPHFAKSVGFMVIAVILALGTNAGSLLATSEYSKSSTRGKSPITINAQGESVEPSSGLDIDYVTEYSYGITESLNMIVPRLTGGGSGERPPEDGATVEYLMKLGLPKIDAVDFAQGNIPMYWGDQPIVEAPAYLGVGVFFLAIIGLFLLKGRLKWWAVGVGILSLLLSYGKNLEFLTQLFFDYVPLYNKFRAVSSILVLLELVVPVLAACGLYKFLFSTIDKKEKTKALLYSSGVLGGILVLFALAGNSIFDFASPIDRYFIENEQLGMAFVDAIRADRWEMLRADSLRSLLIVGLITVALWVFIKEKLSLNLSIAAVGLVVLFDLVNFNNNYISDEDYLNSREYDNAIVKTSADVAAANDSGHYRVYDLIFSPNNSGRASAFNNALGGYHGAKPGRFQDLVDFYIYGPQQDPSIRQENIEILSMFNVRYILDRSEDGTIAKKNPLAMGNAWFVKEYQAVEDQNQEIQNLQMLKGDSVAFITLEEKAKINLAEVNKDSTSVIELTSYKPGLMKYRSQNKNAGLAVFSEMYYPHGWTATIDGNEVPIARVNYALRGLAVPAGEHEIVFKFEPEVVKTGSTIMLISNILLFLAIAGGLFFSYRQSKSIV